jgi:hypothetical protein
MATFNGKKVVDIEIDGVESWDYPDFCDAYFLSACYEDGLKLTDEELEEFASQNGDLLNEMSHEFYR